METVCWDLQMEGLYVSAWFQFNMLEYIAQFEHLFVSDVIYI
jgi:hypothetical protein